MGDEASSEAERPGRPRVRGGLTRGIHPGMTRWTAWGYQFGEGHGLAREGCPAQELEDLGEPAEGDMPEHPAAPTPRRPVPPAIIDQSRPGVRWKRSSSHFAARKTEFDR